MTTKTISYNRTLGIKSVRGATCQQCGQATGTVIVAGAYAVHGGSCLRAFAKTLPAA